MVYNKSSETLQYVTYAPCEIRLPWGRMILTVTQAGVGVIQQNGKQMDVLFRTSKTEEIHREFDIKQASKMVL